MALTEWTMQGTEVVNCNCECGCPCQFSRLPTHGNCIVNDGAATAADIRRLIDRCKSAVRDRFGVELREEIVYLGDF